MQVDTMKSQLLEMTELKEESESKLKVSESLIATLNEALRDAPSNIKSGLNLPPGRLTLIIEAPPSANSPSSYHTAYEREGDSESQAVSLSIDLEYMTQLRDMAETRAAAIALVGSGNRVLEAVQQLSLSTQPSARTSVPPVKTVKPETIISVSENNPSLTPGPVLSSEQNIKRGRQEGYVNRKNSDESNNLHEDTNIFAFTSVEIASYKNPFGDVDVGVSDDDDNGAHSKNANSIARITGRMIDSSHYDTDNISMNIHGGDEDDNDRRSNLEMDRNSHNHRNRNLSMNEKHHVKYQDVINQLQSSPKRSYGDDGIIFPPQSPFRHVPDLPQPGIRGLVQDNQGHGRVQGRGQSNSKPHRGSSERLGSVKSPERHNLNNYRSTSRVP
jgi:hypothetical protein